MPLGLLIQSSGSREVKSKKDGSIGRGTFFFSYDILWPHYLQFELEGEAANPEGCWRKLQQMKPDGDCPGRRIC
jgi:hypothetical protein